MQTIMMLLILSSAMTTLFTEAIKKWLDDTGHKYRPNILAGVSAIIVSVGIAVCYIILTRTTVTPVIIVWVFILIVLSWLCAMVGYDKVKQTLLQVKTGQEALPDPSIPESQKRADLTKSWQEESDPLTENNE